MIRSAGFDIFLLISAHTGSSHHAWCPIPPSLTYVSGSVGRHLWYVYVWDSTYHFLVPLVWLVVTLPLASYQADARPPAPPHSAAPLHLVSPLSCIVRRILWADGEVHADGGQLGTDDRWARCASPRSGLNTHGFLMDHSLTSHHNALKIPCVFRSMGIIHHACTCRRYNQIPSIFFPLGALQGIGVSCGEREYDRWACI